MTQLAGKTAVILGASSAGGIGDAIARLFVAEGANVIISGRKQAPLLSLAKEIKAEVKTCDITDEAEIEALFGAAKHSFGSVDIAVNAAGVNLPGPIASITREDLQMLCDIHFIGGTLFIKQAAAAMGEGGSIITLSSVTAELTGPNLAGYGATKAAVDKVVKVAAIEYGPKGIRVNSISPSLTNTPMTSKVFETPSMVAAFEKETPLGRLVTAQDVAHTALYLANDRCVATGDNMRVSGGAHLRRLPTYQEMMNT